MRAYDLYNRFKKEYHDSGLEEQAKIEGWIDKINEFYDEVHDFCYSMALNEDFTDEEFKNDFYKKYDGEIVKPKIGNYRLIALFSPINKDPKPLTLVIKKIKREQDIALIDKTRINISSKYFEDYESLKAFAMEIKMRYSGKYRVDIEHENN